MKRGLLKVLYTALIQICFYTSAIAAGVVSRIDIVGNIRIPQDFIKSYFQIECYEHIDTESLDKKLDKWSRKLYESGYFIFVDADYLITDSDSIEISISVAEKTLMFRNEGSLAGSCLNLYNLPVFGIDCSTDLGNKSQFLNISLHDVLFRRKVDASISVGHDGYSTVPYSLPDSSKKYDALEVAPEISTSVFNLIRFYTRFPYRYCLIEYKGVSDDGVDSSWKEKEDNFGFETGVDLDREYLKHITMIGYSLNLFFHTGFSPQNYWKWFIDGRFFFAPPIKNELAIRLLFMNARNTPVYHTPQLDSPRLLRGAPRGQIFGNKAFVANFESRSTDLITVKTPMMRLISGILLFADVGMAWNNEFPKEKLQDYLNVSAGPGLSVEFSYPIDLLLQIYYGYGVKNCTGKFCFSLGTMF